LFTAVSISTTTTQFGSLAELKSLLTVPSTGNPNPLNPFLTSSSSLLQEHRVPSPIETSSNSLKTIHLNHNSPLISNQASKNPALTTNPSPTLPLLPQTNPPPSITLLLPQQPLPLSQKNFV
ncbi:unnamed protein product, partial [Brassica rapa subsp. narinosa]